MDNNTRYLQKFSQNMLRHTSEISPALTQQLYKSNLLLISCVTKIIHTEQNKPRLPNKNQLNMEHWNNKILIPTADLYLDF